MDRKKEEIRFWRARKLTELACKGEQRVPVDFARTKNDNSSIHAKATKPERLVMGKKKRWRAP